MTFSYSLDWKFHDTETEDTMINQKYYNKKKPEQVSGIQMIGFKYCLHFFLIDTKKCGQILTSLNLNLLL